MRETIQHEYYQNIMNYGNFDLEMQKLFCHQS